MGKIAFVFSGQGDQYPGMGKELYDSYEVAREIFRMCDRIRPGTTEQCFYGTDDELRMTVNTQPCLYAVELAAAQTLKGMGMSPDMAAGFSLGEVTACAFSGIVTYEEGMQLVMRRGELMQDACRGNDTFMAAVMRLETEKLEEICSCLKEVYPVNYNCPGQITVSGSTASLDALKEMVQEAGGRILPLKVGGPFHSPFMKEAAKEFRKELEHASLREPGITIYSDVTAEPYDGNMAELLSEQIKSPVRWENLIRNMIRDGMATCVEIGPGKTLTGMTKKIDRQIRTLLSADMSGIEKGIREC